MKKFFPLILLIVLTIASCKKKTTSPGTSNTFTATINGTIPFSSNTVYSSNLSSGNSVLYAFVGYATDSSWMDFYVTSLSVGTQTCDTGLRNPSISYEPDGQQGYGTSYPNHIGRGAINITSSSGSEISGTFNGTLYSSNGDSVIITNGVFTNCAY